MLLPGSETFIRNQTDTLRLWQPSLFGLTEADSPLARASDTVLFGSSLPEKALLRSAIILGHSQRVSRALAASHPDLVHIHFLAGHANLVSRTAKRLDLPIVITAHGFDVTTIASNAGPRAGLVTERLRNTMARASLVIAVSEFIRSKVIQLGCDPAKVVVHHIGIPIPKPPAPSIVKIWDVAFVGRFVEKKGVLDLIAALARLNSEIRPRCVFIGEGPLLGPAKEAVERMQIDATFLGAQPPAVVQKTLRAARVFAAPSRTAENGDSEGLPIAILEAAAARLPVASTYHSGIPEAVLDGETGLLSPEGDVDALAMNLRHLLRSPTLRLQLGSAGRHRTEQEFDIVKQTAVLEELYDAASREHRASL